LEKEVEDCCSVFHLAVCHTGNIYVNFKGFWRRCMTFRITGFLTWIIVWYSKKSREYNISKLDLFLSCPLTGGWIQVLIFNLLTIVLGTSYPHISYSRYISAWTTCLSSIFNA
jgi:hypothetical protein